PLGPSGDVDGDALKNHVVAVRAESLAQSLILVELLARLVEVDHAKARGAFDGAGIGRDLSGENAQQGRLAGAVEAEQPQARARAKGEAEIAEERASAEFFGDVLHRNQALGAAVGGREIDLRDAF